MVSRSRHIAWLRGLVDNSTVRILSTAFFSLAWITVASAEIVITDVTGRTVTLEAPARRILLEAPAYYPALSLITENAADLVVGVSASPVGTDFGPEYEAGTEILDKPRVGSIWAQTFSVERALELKPDLMIAGARPGGLPAAIESSFSKLGVPIIYIDFAQNPTKNLAASIEIVGKAIGEEDSAAAFIAFAKSRVDRITQRLTDADVATLLVLTSGRNLPCCLASSNNSALSYFGGKGIRNIAEGVGSSQTTQLGIEYIIDSDPDVLIFNDAGSGAGSIFGFPRSLDQGVASLERLVAEPGLRDLSATRHSRVHGIDLFLFISPLNFVAFEALAKWSHPDLLADIDPQETLTEINRRFLKTPLKGPFWVSLDKPPEKQP